MFQFRKYLQNKKLFVSKGSAWILNHTNTVVLFLGFLMFVIVILGVNSWKYTFIGDEWVFFTTAKDIAVGIDRPNLFSLLGVFGTNPVLSSYWQAAFMKIFGISNFSWRLSNVILVIPCVWFFFKWIESLVSKMVAFSATIFFVSSSFLFGYFKLGYPNPVSLTVFCAVLFFSAKMILTGLRKWSVATGVALGIGYYFVFGTLFPFMLLLSLLCPIFLSSGKVRLLVIQNSFIIFVTAFLFVIPSLFSFSDYLHNVQTHSALKPEYSSSSQILINAKNTLILFFKNSDYFHNHFIQGAYFDVLSQAFIILGLVSLYNIIFQNRNSIKKKNVLFILSFYLSTVLILTLTNPYSYTPATRGHLLIPFGSFCAGLGFWYVTRKISSHRIVPLIFLLVVLVSVNLFKSELLVEQRVGTHYYSQIIKLLRSNSSVQILVHDDTSIDMGIINLLKLAYNIDTLLIVSDPDSGTCPEVNDVIVVLSQELDHNMTMFLNNCHIAKFEILEYYK